MSALGAWQIIPTGAGATRTVFNSGPVTVPGGPGVLLVPHTLDQPNPGGWTCDLLVVVHNLTMNNAITQIGVDDVDAANIRVTNQGALADDVLVQAIMMPKWLNYNGVDTPFKHYDAQGINVLAAGATLLSASLMTDDGVTILPPLQAGCIPEISTAGNWGRFNPPMPSLLETLNNDDAINALDFNCGNMKYSSQNRILAGMLGSAILLTDSGVVTIAPAGQVGFVHGIASGSAAMIPDLAWFCPTGGPAEGVALAAPVNITLNNLDALDFTLDNENLVGGEDVTGIMYCMYAWSGGRYA